MELSFSFFVFLLKVQTTSSIFETIECVFFLFVLVFEITVTTVKDGGACKTREREGRIIRMGKADRIFFFFWGFLLTLNLHKECFWSFGFLTPIHKKDFVESQEWWTTLNKAARGLSLIIFFLLFGWLVKRKVGAVIALASRVVAPHVVKWHGTIHRIADSDIKRWLRFFFYVGLLHFYNKYK